MLDSNQDIFLFVPQTEKKICQAPVRKLQNQIESAGSDIRVKRISAAIDGPLFYL